MYIYAIYAVTSVTIFRIFQPQYHQNQCLTFHEKPNVQPAIVVAKMFKIAILQELSERGGAEIYIDRSLSRGLPPVTTSLLYSQALIAC